MRVYFYRCDYWMKSKRFPASFPIGLAGSLAISVGCIEVSGP